MGYWRKYGKRCHNRYYNYGANITSAVSSLKWLQVPCFSHTLQPCVDKVLKMPAVVKAVARSMTHFHHSSKSSYLWQEEQKSLGHKEHSLGQAVATWWNSTFYMLERIRRAATTFVWTLLELHKADLMTSDTEFTTMEAVMKPVVEITEQMEERIGLKSQKWGHSCTNYWSLTYCPLLTTTNLWRPSKKICWMTYKKGIQMISFNSLLRPPCLTLKLKVWNFIVASEEFHGIIYCLELDVDLMRESSVNSSNEICPPKQKRRRFGRFNRNQWSQWLTANKKRMKS